MAVKRTFLITLIFFLLVWGFSAIDRIGAERVKEDLTAREIAALTPAEMQFLAEHPAVREQVEEIDRQITELEQMKRGYEARAMRQDDQAQRLQFEDRAYLETRRHLELAEENRTKAERTQQEIDRLKAEKRKLLQYE